MNRFIALLLILLISINLYAQSDDFSSQNKILYDNMIEAMDAKEYSKAFNISRQALAAVQA